MIDDTAAVEFNHQVEPNIEESLNTGARRCYKVWNSAQNFLWHGCEYSELFLTVRMISIKYEYNMYHSCFNAMTH